ncbi:anti-sigma factor family protein [Amorphoplanes digitatis]|uniref:Anti-sigma-K factor RskA n=1 Tax=Actinoplanes digitatis TaxID=1868 RepID=A0A7W7I617_9ACTN|nr:zf-HC2 domain-containing protein [Actinoplanes digitatis]MBB4766966.1 anti-sigma-K factor RskA [Actinoplanes digitatis]GID95502.1 anti-sigma factor [Actinoplanes digitatis]
MRCDHEHDDGAYVLGALSPAERAAYERHLATCSFCREAVADIAVLPGLLGRLDAAEFEKLLAPDLLPPPPSRRTSVPDLVMAAQSTRRQERRRVRWRVLGSALAAACLALVVGVGTVFWMGRGVVDPSVTGPTVAMTPASDRVPVTANINLTGAAGGTKINLVCFYNRGNEESEPYRIRLMAYGPNRESEQLGSWVASPGKEFTMSGVTHFTAGTLSRLALVRNDDRTLLSYDVP